MIATSLVAGTFREEIWRVDFVARLNISRRERHYQPPLLVRGSQLTELQKVMRNGAGNSTGRGWPADFIRAISDDGHNISRLFIVQRFNTAIAALAERSKGDICQHAVAGAGFSSSAGVILPSCIRLRSQLNTIERSKV